jgi:large subunit ribosomal protein L17
MKHLRQGKKFGRTRNQRRALLKGLAASFFMQGRLKTTEAKAKALRPLVERIITRGKKMTLANRRLLSRSFSAAVVAKIESLAQSYQGLSGGYTRIVKLAARRSDAARMAILEVVK